MCLITDNIKKIGDIWLEIINYKKTSLIEMRYHAQTSITTFIFHPIVAAMWEKQLFNQKDIALENNW